MEGVSKNNELCPMKTESAKFESWDLDNNRSIGQFSLDAAESWPKKVMDKALILDIYKKKIRSVRVF